jgi:SAM-dependent methyltransferase
MTCTSRVLHRDDLDEPQIAATIRAIDPAGTSARHRKGWEQAMTVLAFQRGGVLDRDGLCLSVAAGHEMVLYHLTSRFSLVVASDLYADAGDWAANEGDLSMLVDPDRFAPGPYDRRRLVACHLDALDLRFPDGLFDATYSLSSIEHIGGDGGARAMLAEMARVTKPGGVVVVTTEVLTDGGPDDSMPGVELFSPGRLEALVAAEPRLSWLDDVDLRPPDDGCEEIPIVDAITLRASGLEVPEHLRIRTPHGRSFTSVCLALRRTA